MELFFFAIILKSNEEWGYYVSHLMFVTKGIMEMYLIIILICVSLIVGKVDHFCILKTLVL